jgi:hypothetical protein
MQLLLEHFGIADHDLARLAWALAFEHVPGFQIVPEQKSARGRKNEWDGFKLKALFDAVHEVKTKHKLTDRQALKFLSTNPQFANTWGRPKNHKGSRDQWIETLESRLQDSKRYVAYIESLPAMLEDARVRVRRKKFQKL